jgi:PleD family two-component response regulator
MASKTALSERPGLTTRGADARQLRTPARVMTVTDQPVLAEVIRFALNHGAFHTRTVRDEAQAIAVLHEWHPQLAIVDMDLAKDRSWTASLQHQRPASAFRSSRSPDAAICGQSWTPSSAASMTS